MEVASKLDPIRLRSYAFQGICLSLSSSRQFDKAIAVANRTEEYVIRGVLLQRISNELLSAGKLDESKRLAMTIPTVNSMTYALEDICIVLKEQERIDEFIEVADSIPNAFTRDALLRQVQQISNVPMKKKKTFAQSLSIYPNNLKIWFLAKRKLPRFNDRK